MIINLILYLIFAYNEEHNNKYSKCASKVLKLFKLSIYIRLFFELYLLILLMSVQELYYYLINYKNYSKSDRREYMSMRITYSIIGLLAIFLALVLLSWICHLKTAVIDEKCLTRELYAGILQVPKNN